MKCDFCGDECSGKLVLIDANIQKKDGSEIVLCAVCLDAYANREYDKIKLKGSDQKEKTEIKESYNPFGTDKEGRAVWECLKRMYKEAKPSSDIEKIAKSGEGKMQNFFMAYYLPQKRCSQIVEGVCKEFKLTGMSKRCVHNTLWMGSAPNSSEKTWKEERKDYKERLKKHLQEKK